MEMTACPCGYGSALEYCCKPIIDGALAPTAEALMRSRFTAFALGNLDYIDRTNMPVTHDPADKGADSPTSATVEWTRLEIIDIDGGGADDETGMVEFAAHYTHKGMAGIHRERSIFRRENGAWLYVDGDLVAAEPLRLTKIGRNEPCPCGSGKKYKKCCGLACRSGSAI